MRAREFLKETANIPQMKSDIINQVSNSNDAEFIQKVYTVINKSGLTDRISPILKRDTDTKGYTDQLVNIIIETPGTYEEKKAFVDEYPNGYIDIPLMLSGKYIKFEELIKGSKTAPLDFVRRVFDALKQVTFGTAKGPGEFALAVLSPHIKITGKGDLNIGKEIIEVKAAATNAGGRVGAPGLLHTERIQEILKKYMNINFAPGEGLNLKQLSATMTGAGLDTATKQQLATELFNYIFKGEADVSEIVTAVVSGQDPNPYYLKANYEVYQKESGFTGMMLMNFPAQALKYFKDPMQMASEIYAFSVYLVSATAGFTTRQILSQVTLRPVKEPTQAVPATSKKQPKSKSPAQNQPAAVKAKGAARATKSTQSQKATAPGIQNQQSTMNVNKVPMGQPPIVP